ncbi:MAG: porin family protein [Cyclobacteriaceae bacterium]
MKKILLVFAIACLPLMSASAQGIGIGLKGGLNFANQSIGDVPGDISSRTGFHGGVYAHISLGKLGIQPEVLYSTIGSKFDGGGIIDDFENKTAYFTVPLLLRFNIAFLNIHAGPQFGFLINAETEANGIAQDVQDQYKSGDFSIAAGVGANLPLNLNVTARYVAGLSDVNDNLTALGDISNSTFQLSIGYRLIGKE